MGSERRVAVDAGASQGVGAGVVEGFRAHDHAVVADARTPAGGADEGVVAVPGDMAERDAAERVVRTALDRFGRIDTLVDNAGTFIGKPFTEYTDEDPRRIDDVELFGSSPATQFLIPEMSKRGRGDVVQITATRVEPPLLAVMSGLTDSTEGGLAAMTRSPIIEHASPGIRVSASPSWPAGRSTSMGTARRPTVARRFSRRPVPPARRSRPRCSRPGTGAPPRRRGGALS